MKKRNRIKTIKATLVASSNFAKSCRIHKKKLVEEVRIPINNILRISI